MFMGTPACHRMHSADKPYSCFEEIGVIVINPLYMTCVAMVQRLYITLTWVDFDLAGNPSRNQSLNWTQASFPSKEVLVLVLGGLLISQEAQKPNATTSELFPVHVRGLLL